MRALVLIHRWLGIAFCLLFAMWFASGIVMHFVPFPALTETERVEGLAPLDPSARRRTPAEAIEASGIIDPRRVRLVARPGGSVYIVEGATGLSAFHAADLSKARVSSETAALAIAVDHARQRGLDPTHAAFLEVASHDQWTVPNGMDVHRPLYRIAINDGAGTELYVSSHTGEVVRDTTRTERRWNYAGSVVHWIYPTVLRRNWPAWDATVWWLSLVAMIGAMSGAALGVLRIRVSEGRVATPFRGWHAWHHWLGLASMTFVLTWIFSGWLSMDHGRLFSTGKASAEESAGFAGAPRWQTLGVGEVAVLPPQAREIEWFAFDGRIYRRERLGPGAERLVRLGDSAFSGRFLRAEEVSAAAERAGMQCLPAEIVQDGDAYPIPPAIPDARVYRSICGDAWLHVDGANGAVLEKLDASRRAYRWFYEALHTFDFAALRSRPRLRTALIVVLCSLGLVFSVTGVTIGWKRLRRDFGRQ